MKKLLLVLLVVALASFLLVGCLPTTPAEGEGEGEGEGEVEVVMTWDSEYTNAAGETFIRCDDDILTVTTPTPVETDYVVYVAVKQYFGVKVDDGEDYTCIVALKPDATRTIWTLDYTYETGSEPSFLDGCCPDFGECDPFCVVALLKHPCCPGEEIALRVVLADCTPPYSDLYVTFYDCGDPCEEPDPCDPPVPGAYMEWTSRIFDGCETIDCCGDDCSGFASWSMEVDPDLCLGPCDLVSELSCPVEGALDCGCLPYPTTGTSEVIVVWTMTDNVGNEASQELSIILDTDEVVSVDGVPVTFDVAVPIVADACVEPG